MSYWIYTDPLKSGVCERCKRPAEEHAHTCVACKRVLAPGNVTSFALHSYRDHPPGMKHSTFNLCYCPRSAVLAMQPPAVAVQPQVRPVAFHVQQQQQKEQQQQRPPDSERCACGGCAACTAQVECFRPPEAGCNGKCIVCHFMSAVAPGAAAPRPAPVATSPVEIPAPVPVPEEYTESPVEIVVESRIVVPGVLEDDGT